MYTHAYKYGCKNGRRREGRILLFRRMYFRLFRAVTDALCMIQAGNVKEAEQKTTEDMYLSAKSIKMK